MYHNPVLLTESLDGLSVRPEGTYVDVTFGGGGHSRSLLQRLTTGRLIAFDQDEDSATHAIDDPRFHLIHRNFRYLIHFLRFLDALPVDGILADLGISSHQIDVPERGFSTRYNAPIDMRMNRTLKITAREVLNTYDTEKLTEIFRNYGELDHPYKAASLIVARRSEQEITHTHDVHDVLRGIIPRGREHQFMAQVFQALRIEVNREMDALQELLQQSLMVLKPNGRLAVISYHSLEDRMVKNFMKTGNVQGQLEKDFYGNNQSSIRPVTRKPIIPGTCEQSENTRSRSAKLRIAEKC